MWSMRSKENGVGRRRSGEKGWRLTKVEVVQSSLGGDAERRIRPRDREGRRGGLKLRKESVLSVRAGWKMKYTWCPAYEQTRQAGPMRRLSVDS